MNEVDALVVVDILMEKLPRTELRLLEEGFSYQRGDPLPELGLGYRTQGYLTLEQACAIVEWKAQTKKRMFREENTDLEIRERTRAAAVAVDTHEDYPDSHLTKLNRVGVAIASTFLAAYDPDGFGIVDRRCCRALTTLTGSRRFDLGKRTWVSTEEFRLYTLVLRRWSLNVGMTPRDLDKALWEYDKRNNGPLPR